MFLEPLKTGDMGIQRTGMSVTPTGSNSLIITPEEKSRFTMFFDQSGPIDGYLSAPVAKEIFLKSQLPNEILGSIWQLADRDNTAKFGLNQFLLAMTLITRMKQGQLMSVPSFVPPSLWNSIVGSGMQRMPTRSATSPGFPAVGLTPSPLPPAATSVSPTPPPNAELLQGITEQERLQYSGFFDILDTTQKGALTAQETSSFFLKSRLPPTELGQIWDVVDESKSGTLNRQGFITAMHLIKKRVNGGSIPSRKTTAAADLLDLDMTIQSPVIKDKVMSPPVLGSKDPFMDPIKAGTGTSSIPTAVPSSLPTTLPGGLPAPLPTTLPTTLPSTLPTTLGSGPGGLPPSLTSGASAIGLHSTLPSGLPGALPASSTLGLEARDVAQRDQALQSRKQEVQSLEKELMDLTPSAEEIKKRREEIDEEFKSVTEKRNQLLVQVSTLRATYEAEVQVVRDAQETLIRERGYLQTAQVECNQVQEALKVFTAEKERLEGEKTKQQEELAQTKKKIQELTDETKVIREELESIRSQVKQQQQYLDVNLKVLESSRVEYQHVKRDLENEKDKLEADRARVVQLEREASVQEAITRRERERISEMEKERQKTLSKSQELLAGMESLDVQGPPPTIPSPLTKPVKSDASLRKSMDALPTVGAPDMNPVASSVPVPIPSNPSPIAPATSPPKAPLSATTFSPSSPPKRDAKLEQDDLDALISSNRPKSPSKPVEALTPNSTLETQTKPIQNKVAPVDFDSFFSAPLADAKITRVATMSTPQEFTFDTSFQMPKSTSFGDFTDVSETKPAKPDLDAAFGAPVVRSGEPSGFGAVDFDSAFPAFPAAVPDFPPRSDAPPKPETTSSPDTDSTEVKNIIAMGFSREQAINALEM
jgi:epidermal growth factor receptor substrate 15